MQQTASLSGFQEGDFLRIALLGADISHSLSPTLFKLAARQSGLSGEYQLYPTPGPLLPVIQQLVQQGYQGLQFTAPFKTVVPPLLSLEDVTVRDTGACNTLRITAAGLQGTNTDIAGIRFQLEEFWELPPLERILLLGAGGAARAAAVALEQLYPAIDLCQYNRSKPRLLNFDAWSGNRFTPCRPGKERPFELIINATPLPQSGWPDQFHLTPGGRWFDLSYRRDDPPPTDSYCNGLPMLAGQATAAYRFLFNQRIDTGQLLAALLIHLHQ